MPTLILRPVATVWTRLLSFVLSLTVLLLAVAPVVATSIQTDLWVYAQGDTVNVSGDGFGASEDVEIVTTDPYAVEIDRGTVQADPYGNIFYSFVLSSDVPGIYDVVATGLNSGLTASTQFDPPNFGITLVATGIAPSTVNYSDWVNFAGTVTCINAGGGAGNRCPTTAFSPVALEIQLQGGSFASFTTVASLSTSVTFTGAVGGGVGCASTCSENWSFSWQAGSYSGGSVAPGTYAVRARATGFSGTQNSTQVANGLTLTIEGTSTEYLGDFSATEFTTLSLNADIDDLDGGDEIGEGVFSPDTNLASTVPSTNGIKYELWAGVDCTGLSPVAGPVYDDVNDSGGASGASMSLAAVGLGTYYLKTTYLGNAFYAGSSVCDQIDVESAVTHVTAAITADDKVYDGNTDADYTCELTGVNLGDDVTCDGTHPGVFSSKDVGTWTVTATGLALSGADAADYVLDNTSDTDTAEISQLGIAIDFSAADKVYDGGTAADVTGCSPAGVISPDVVGCDYSLATANFANKNVGTWDVSGSGFSLNGADAGNYSITTVNDASAEITVRHLTAAITGVDKIYDGNTEADYTCDLSNVVGTEDVTCDGTQPGVFSSKDVGTRTVTASGLFLGGTEAGNYVLDTLSDTDSAEITKKDLHVIAENKSKVFGDPNPPLTWHYMTSDFVSGEGASDIDSPPTCSTTALQFSLPGTYPITCSGSDNNYNLVSVNGTLTILNWTLLGFYQPVDMGGVVNTVKGGSTVPLKFEVFAGSTELTSTSVVSSFQTQLYECDSSVYEDPIEIVTTGGTSLRYDSTGGQFIQNWKTPKAPNTCYRVTMTTQDGSNLVAWFKLK